ncbi:hypothetical protein NIIDMKKI_74190 [Mycobacterium kansasii]|uniref:Uncharacterized protein n=1 Tax=Mycobacterium kansasii TaxID=1768 RepID=A0A7G1IR74_MYCKA|nr:hypothetical protein NIIDMKKI_74190 [Mycobacterium kansasii]
MESVFQIQLREMTYRLPRRGPDCHVGAQEEPLIGCRAMQVAADHAVDSEYRPTQRNVVIVDRAGDRVDGGVLKTLANRLDPIRVNNGIGIDPADDLTARVVEPTVTRRRDTQMLILVEQPYVDMGFSS